MSELRPGGTFPGSVGGPAIMTVSLTTLFTVTSQGRMWGPFAASNGILEQNNRTGFVAGGIAAQ